MRRMPGQRRGDDGFVASNFDGVDGRVEDAAELVRRMRDLVHRQGGFGIVQKRGTKTPPFLTSALAKLSRRPGWVVAHRRLGRGPYAGRQYRIVWLHSKVLQAAVVMARAGVAVGGQPS